MALEPPPEGSHPTVELAEAVIQQWAEIHGYATVRRKSRFDKRSPPSVRKVWIICDKGGKPRTIKSLEVDEEPEKELDRDDNNEKRSKRRRLAGSRKTDCPFELTVTRTLETWEIKIINGTHNHEPFITPTAHPSLRKRTNEEEALVKGNPISHLLNSRGEINPMLLVL